MLKPSVKVHIQNNLMIAEFWDCLRLDPMPVQELKKLYEFHLLKGGLPQMVVDLSGVGFAGSSALGNFVAIHRLARQNGGRLVFCNVEPTVRDVFRASKLESLFEFSVDRDTAILAATEETKSEIEGRRERASANPAPAAAGQDGSSSEPTGIGMFRRRRDGSKPS